MVCLNTPVCAFDTPAAEFSLPATDGQTYTLAQLRGPKGLLLMFICNHCPYVLRTIEALVADANALQDKGIGVAAICANDAATYPDDSFANMVEFAAQHRFSFPYLHDESQAVAKAYGAVCTPDLFGYNADLRLQYRGNVTELRAAMLEIAATGCGPQQQTPSMGCSLKWRTRVSPH